MAVCRCLHVSGSFFFHTLEGAIAYVRHAVRVRAQPRLAVQGRSCHAGQYQCRSIVVSQNTSTIRGADCCCKVLDFECYAHCTQRITKPLNYVLRSPSREQVAAQPALECMPLVMEPESAMVQHTLYSFSLSLSLSLSVCLSLSFALLLSVFIISFYLFFSAFVSCPYFHILPCITQTGLHQHTHARTHTHTRTHDMA